MTKGPMALKPEKKKGKELNKFQEDIARLFYTNKKWSGTIIIFFLFCVLILLIIIILDLTGFKGNVSFGVFLFLGLLAFLIYIPSWIDILPEYKLAEAKKKAKNLLEFYKYKPESLIENAFSIALESNEIEKINSWINAVENYQSYVGWDFELTRHYKKKKDEKEKKEFASKIFKKLLEQK